MPKAFQEDGVCRGSDIAHAATIVASSSRRVHMFASVKVDDPDYRGTRRPNAGRFQQPASERAVIPRRTNRAYLLDPAEEEPDEPDAPPEDELSPPGERPVTELAAAPFVGLVVSFLATFFFAFFLA